MININVKVKALNIYKNISYLNLKFCDSTHEKNNFFIAIPNKIYKWSISIKFRWKTSE